jgi:putative FmdB family regulatory protein
VPLYEYECKSCHSLIERIQKFSDPPMTVCPHCGGELEQVLSAPAVQFKGSGWYVTDYQRKAGSSQPESGKSEPASSGNGSGPSAKKDSGETRMTPSKDSSTKKS